MLRRKGATALTAAAHTTLLDELTLEDPVIRTADGRAACDLSACPFLAEHLPAIFAASRETE